MPSQRTLAGAALSYALLESFTLDDAIAIVCSRFDVSPTDVITAVRSCRYLVFNATKSGPIADALLAEAPSDVIPIPYGFTLSEETAQQRVLMQLGARVTYLPSLVVYQPEQLREENGESIIVPAHYREIRLSKSSDWAQLNDMTGR